MYLRDIAIYADESVAENRKNGFVARFHRDSCGIVDHYRHCLGRSVKTLSTAKVLLLLKDVSVLKAFQVKGEGDVKASEGGTLICMCPFEFAQYECGDVPVKQRLLCGVIQGALHFLSLSYGWSHDAIASAYEAVIASDFTFQGMLPETWLSPDRKHRIRIWFEWELEWIRLYGVLFRNRSSTELSRHFLAKIVPENGILRHVICKGKWISSRRFRLESGLFFGNAWTVDFSDTLPR